MFKIRKIHCTRLAKYKSLYLVYTFSNFIGDFTFTFTLVKKSAKETSNIHFNEKRNKEPQSDNPFHYRL